MARARGVGVDAAARASRPAARAGKIFFDPSKTRVGIVTCGGLCPGLNNVIRGLVMELTRHYGVNRIVGFRNGYQGFIARYGRPVMELTPDVVARHQRGRRHDPRQLARAARTRRRSSTASSSSGSTSSFVIGGDGSLHGAQAIADVVAERGLRIAIVGVPKTIDNDIPFIDHSFGFRTAFSRATESIRAAHIEARSAPGGVGLVKLMGRHSGFIACYAALAKNDADYVLIPEVPFELDGEHGFLAAPAPDRAGARARRDRRRRGRRPGVPRRRAGRRRRVRQRRACTTSSGSCSSGSPTTSPPTASSSTSSYLDPSYAIRSVPANPYDSVYCVRLAHAAVHAAMAGRTEVVVGRWHGRFVHIPIPVAVSRRSTVDPDGDLWLSVLESTGQPARFARPAEVRAEA